MRKSKKRKATGQMAIFAILIFQSLFFLFAMSLNIALVVHDKINLQNSVDLAAYYGAMKQAEMMNAIAHINFQIRQSWKLLAWRYRVLGSVGVTNPEHPFSSKRPQPKYLRHDDLVTFYRPLTDKRSPGNKGLYFMCLAHQWWKGFIFPSGDTIDIKTILSSRDSSNVTRSDAQCNQMETKISPPRNRGNKFGGGEWLEAQESLDDAIKRLKNQIHDTCNIVGFNTWLFTAISFANLRQDQAIRKKMIYLLAEKMSESEPKDLEDDPISKGVRKTLVKNLSYINQQSLLSSGDIKFFNSLRGVNPTSWLSDDDAFDDIGLYADIYYNSGCHRKLNFTTNEPGFVKRDNNQNAIWNPPALKQLFDSISLQPDPWPQCVHSGFCKVSAGLSKKPHIVYYGVEAKIDYRNQIFMPLSNGGSGCQNTPSNRGICLKAKAFAKPFGGGIGPPLSIRSDNLLPPRSCLNDLNNVQLSDREIIEKCTPNYSRFPGDKNGLMSQRVHYLWANYLKNRNNTEYNRIQSYIKEDPHDRGNITKHDDKSPLATQVVSQGFQAGHDYNPAWLWELIAIAPDFFDVAYFTILPNYQEAYFEKIKRLLENRMPEVRGDLGYPDLPLPNRRYYSLLEQMGASQNAIPPAGTVWQELRRTYNHHLLELPYKVQNPDHLLTGWNPPIADKRKEGDKNFHATDPLLRNTTFQKCGTWGHDLGLQPTETKGWIAGGCIQRGRTGYSVKLVNPKYADSFSPQPTGGGYWH